MLYCGLSWTEMENLFLGCRAVKPSVSKSNGGHINVDTTMDEETLRRQFRFSKDDLPVLTEALKIPTIRSSQSVSLLGQETHLMGLRRLAQACVPQQMVVLGAPFRASLVGAVQHRQPFIRPHLQHLRAPAGGCQQS
ncbi:hypothetical protein MTO96_035281 [Rhipicephalus appendiculatus]